MKLGTYTTIDSPSPPNGEAFEDLKKEFLKIDGRAWEKMNAHDFGSYLSFEIDYSDAIEDAKERLENFNLYEEDDDEEIPEHILQELPTTDEEVELQNQIDDWQTKADEIEKRYSAKFFKD